MCRFASYFVPGGDAQLGNYLFFKHFLLLGDVNASLSTLDGRSW